MAYQVHPLKSVIINSKVKKIIQIIKRNDNNVILKLYYVYIPKYNNRYDWWSKLQLVGSDYVLFDGVVKPGDNLNPYLFLVILTIFQTYLTKDVS